MNIDGHLISELHMHTRDLVRELMAGPTTLIQQRRLSLIQSLLDTLKIELDADNTRRRNELDSA